MTPFDFPLQAGDVVLFQHDSDLGKLIQKCTNTWASHAAMSLGEDWLIEAHDLGGVRKVHFDSYFADPTYTRIQVRRAPGLNVQAAIAKVLTLNGEPYGTWDLLRIYGYEHFHISTLDQAALDSETHIICSQLTALGLYAGGVDLRPQFKVNTFGLLTPGNHAEAVALNTEYDWRTA
jgi:hypothetical protein